MTVITDLYCEGISDPIPFAGTPNQFSTLRDDALSNSGRFGSRAKILSWSIDGRGVVLDLNRTRVFAMVERPQEDDDDEGMGTSGRPRS